MQPQKGNFVYLCNLDKDIYGHNGQFCTSDHWGGLWCARDVFGTEANLLGVYYDTCAC